MEKIHIKTFDELVKYCERSEVTFKEMNDILTQSINCFFIHDHTKENAINRLKKFWAKWQYTKERPFFIDVDLSIIEDVEDL